MNLASLSKKRFAAKSYDPSRKIPTDTFEQLRTALHLCPSSVNSQPWHFFIFQSEQDKSKIIEAMADFNKAKVQKASHVIVFCAKTEMPEDYLKLLLDQEEQDERFINAEVKAGQEKGRSFFVNQNSRTKAELLTWTSKQLYLALGVLLFSAAALGIDATPMEGFKAQKMDELLGLQAKGLSSVVVAALGYHHAEDFNAGLKKSRLPQNLIFTDKF